MSNNTCYQRIKNLREDADKKQSELADALYMQTTQYGRYERGEREIPLNIAISIAEFYGVSLDYIAGLSDIRRTDNSEISEEERILLKTYRKLGEFEKGQIFERAEMLYEATTKRKHGKDFR